MYQRSPVEPRRNRPARGTLKCPSGRTYQSLRKPTPEGHLSVPLEKSWDITNEFASINQEMSGRVTGPRHLWGLVFSRSRSPLGFF